jgi:nucleotide-binding universal stress UspA family protein
VKVICGTDFSEPADRAVAVAAAVATRLGDTLEVVHVLEPPAPFVPEFSVVPELTGDGATLASNLRERAERSLQALSDRLARQGHQAGWKVLTGFADESLPKYGQEQNARLVALGTHGRRGAARFFLGSVSERVARSARIPVLVVPPAARVGGGLEPGSNRPLRVLAGVDSSPASDAALAWLRDLPIAPALDLSLVHVYWPLREHVRFGVGDLHEAFDSTEDVECLLERELRPRINEILRGLPVTLILRPLLGKEEDPLVREADLAQADLLVLGADQRHGRWGGSTAVATLRAATLPVLCVPGAARPVDRPDRPAPPLRALLVPLELANPAPPALLLAYRLLSATGGTIELLHVVQPSSGGLSSTRLAELETQLRAIRPEQQPRAVLTRAHVVESSSPATAIFQAAERLSVDAIVLAARGGGGLGRALLGSVAEQVVRGSTRPVVLVPVSPDEAPAE